MRLQNVFFPRSCAHKSGLISVPCTQQNLKWWGRWWWWRCCGRGTSKCRPPVPYGGVSVLQRDRTPARSGPAQEYLFIWLQLQRESLFSPSSSSSFFIFRHSTGKQVVPWATRHTHSAQSSVLRSVFTLMGAGPSDLFVSDIFPWRTGRTQRLRGRPWRNHRVGVHEPSALTPFWKWNL